MISPMEMVGNLSTNLTNHFDGFSTGSDPVNIANSVIDPLTNTANIKDGTVNFLENVSAVDIFFVKPDLPHWVGLYYISIMLSNMDKRVFLSFSKSYLCTCMYVCIKVQGDFFN